MTPKRKGHTLLSPLKVWEALQKKGWKEYKSQSGRWQQETESLRHSWAYEHMNSQQLGSMHKLVKDQAITNPNMKSHSY